MSKKTSSKLILASASPRRKEILHLLGLGFTVIEPKNVNEAQIQTRITNDSAHLSTPECARLLSQELASTKALSVLMQNPNAVVIGADTVIATRHEIIGKPSSFEHARTMLLDFCGQSHHVFTGVSIQNEKKSVLFSSESIVTFHCADACQRKWIDQYVKSGLPMDKAGAYGIQDLGAILIQSIEGDYYSVMGLPISQIARKICDFGFETII